MYGCNKCKYICGYDTDDLLVLFGLDGTIVSCLPNYALHGKRVIDVTDDHDDIMTTSKEDPFSARMLQEHKDICEASTNRSPDGKRKWRPLPEHFVVKYPFLCLGILPPDSMIEYSQFNFDWDQHKNFMLKYVIRMSGANEIPEKIEVLNTYFDINYNKFNINFILKFKQLDGLSTLAEKIHVLLSMNFAFDVETIPIEIDQIASLDDDVLEQLVNCGLNLKTLMRNQSQYLPFLSNTSIDRILKFEPDVEFLAATILKRNGVKSLLKNLIENHGLDILSCLNE
jgi:hypothetical protein